MPPRGDGPCAGPVARGGNPRVRWSRSGGGFVQREGAVMARDFGNGDRTWTLRSAADAPQRARRLVGSWLHETDPRAERAQLLVSELVTNVVHHVGSPMVVSCHRGADSIRIEVTDTSLAPPELVTAHGARGGYGLRIVDALSDAWGYERTPRGKVAEKWAALLRRLSASAPETREAGGPASTSRDDEYVDGKRTAA